MYLYQIKIPEGVTEMEVDDGENPPTIMTVQPGLTYPLTCNEEGVGLNTEQISPTRIRVSKIALKELFGKKPPKVG